MAILRLDLWSYARLARTSAILAAMRVGEPDVDANAAAADAAAQAVVCLALGLRLDHVGAGYDGHDRFITHVALGDCAHNRRRHAQQVCALIAGAIARDQVYAAHGQPPSPPDPDRIRQVDVLLGSSSARHLRVACATEAMRQVTALWPDIRRVHRALAERMRLSGDEVHALMRDS